MSRSNYTGDETLSLSALRHIEQLCEEFEETWKSSAPAEIESYLSRAAPAEHAGLLRQLLLLDLAYRRQRREDPTAEEYCRRFPAYAQVVELVFRASARSGTSVLEQTVAAGPGAAPPANRLPEPGQRIGRYRIERELGHGSYGIVYLAMDEELARLVAIKMPRPDRLGPGGLERFWKEAQTVAQLKHAPIVPVYDVGWHENGLPYAVMEYVEGRSLKEWLAAERPAPARAAALIAEIAEAVACAHRRGFVHRDLKPANILLDAEGRPHVADFGLALHESVQRERAGEFAGTLYYMAPEQVRRDAHRLDGRADIWALGVMLYEMLTRRRPFDGATSEQVIDEIQNRDPKPPRQIDATIPEELERICLKCLRKPVAGRYTTARDLAAELRRCGRPRRRVLPAIVGGMAVVAVAACVLVLSRPWRAPPAGPLPPAPPLSGTIDLLICNKVDPARQRLTLRAPQAMPLRAEDWIRVKAELNRPAYVYLVWIDSQGHAQPVYPWKPGDWASMPGEQSPTQLVELPEAADEGWPLRGPGGMETLLLLAREEPLPRDLDLSGLLADLPRQPMHDQQMLVWFDNGHLVTRETDPLRSLGFQEQGRIDDAVLKTHRLIQERLAPSFPLIRAVSVASRGG